MAAWPLQVLHCLQITSQKWLQSESTGFVKKMSWLRNSVHFHYNVRVVRTTRRDCKEHSKGKTDHSFLISSHAWHVTSSIFKPHAPWDHGEPTRIRTDRTDMLAAQGHSDGALWFLVTFGYVAHAESLKWYSLSANFEKLMFLPPTSIRVHTIAVCQSSPLIAWLHHFFTSFGMGQGQGQAGQLHSHLQKHDSGSEIWLNDIG